MRRLAAIKRPKRKRDDAALVHRLGAALPRPSARAAARVAAWLAGVRPKSAGKSLMMLIRRDPPAARLLGGIADAAPYLWDAIDADPARLTRLLLADPNRALAALLGKTRTAAASARSQPELMQILRGLKAEAALLIALTDIGSIWELTHITEALTRVADTAVGDQQKVTNYPNGNHSAGSCLRNSRLRSGRWPANASLSSRLTRPRR